MRMLLLTAAGVLPNLRAAAEKLPLSAAITNTFRLLRGGIGTLFSTLS
jgi:hypothetical protein